MITTVVIFFLQVTKTSDFTNVREVTKRSLLRPGNYCIIPSTYEAGMQSKFYLRLFIEKDWTKNEPCILKPLLSHERVQIENREICTVTETNVTFLSKQMYFIVLKNSDCTEEEP